MMSQPTMLSAEISALKLTQDSNSCKKTHPVLNGVCPTDDGLPPYSHTSLINLNATPPLEFRYIDECNSSSSSNSSACSTTGRKQSDNTSRQSETSSSDTAILQTSSPKKTASLTSQISTVLNETSPPAKRVPSVAVLGYQRAVADSIAAAASNKFDADQKTRNKLPNRSSGLSEAHLDLSTHGIDNRISCAQPCVPYPSIDLDDSPSHTPLPQDEQVEEEELVEAASNDQFNTRKQPGMFCGSHSLWSQLLEDKRLSAEDAESVYHQPPKAADRSAAYRLAKRLFTLDGFKITDVAKHLSKRNDFSQLVGEEFASFFDFSNQTIDAALRTFMLKLSLTGESQERERVLFHFSRRYLTCNPGTFVSDDACHTLVCGLMLLNTDLHSQSVTRKMSCQEFVTNLMELNRGENQYSRDEMKRLYNAFKQEPLRWPIVENPTFNLMSIYGPTTPTSSAMLPSSTGFNYNGGGSIMSQPMYNASSNFSNGGPTQYWADPNAFAAWAAAAEAAISQTPSSPLVASRCQPALSSFPANSSASVTTSTNCSAAAATSECDPGRRLFSSTGFSPFVDLPKDLSAKEYMRGFVMRKWIMESHGKKTSLGKRSWKLFYARLRDLVLYLYKDAETAAAATRAEEMHMAYVQQVYRMQFQYQQLCFHHDQQQAFAAAQTQLQTNGYSSKKDHEDEEEEEEEEDEGFDVDEDELDTTKDLSMDQDPNSAITPDFNLTTSDTSPVNGLSSPASVPVSPSPASDLDVAKVAPAKITSAPAVDLTKGDTNMNFTFAIPPPPPPAPPPETVVCIAHAFACPAEDYTKKPNVFRLKTKDGKEFLFQVNDVKELEFWVDKINYVAGLLSAPSLPSAVGSERSFYRPVLPSGVTGFSVHEQLEDHQKRVIDLTRDLTEMKRRKLSAPSQPNLSYTSRDFTAPSKPPSRPEVDDPLLPSKTFIAKQLNIIVDDAGSKATTGNGDKDECLASQLQAPPSPYIPDSVIKSLQSPSAAKLPSSATTANNTSGAIFSTASLGRRRKRSLLGSSSEMSLAAQQRAEFDDRMKYLDEELTRYKTYARLLEVELCRIQRVAPGFGQSQQFYSPNAQHFLHSVPMNPAGGYFYQPIPPVTPQGSRWLIPTGQASMDQSVLMEEPSVVNGGGGGAINGQPAYNQALMTSQSLPPQGPLGKRVYGPISSSSYGNFRQSSGTRMHRNYHHRNYHLRPKQQFVIPALTPRQSRPSPVQSPASLPPSGQPTSQMDTDQQLAASLYDVL